MPKRRNKTKKEASRFLSIEEIRLLSKQDASSLDKILAYLIRSLLMNQPYLSREQMAEHLAKRLNSLSVRPTTGRLVWTKDQVLPSIGPNLA